MAAKKKNKKYYMSRDMFIAYFLGHPENNGREFYFEVYSDGALVGYNKKREELVKHEIDSLYSMYKEDVINGVLESF